MITGDAHPIAGTLSLQNSFRSVLSPQIRLSQSVAVETCKTLGMGHNILVGSEHLKINSVEEMMHDQQLHQKYGERCMHSNGFAQVTILFALPN